MLNLLDPIPSEEDERERRCAIDKHREPMLWVDCEDCNAEGCLSVLDDEPTDDDPEDDVTCPACWGEKGHWICMSCRDEEEDELGPHPLEEEE